MGLRRLFGMIQIVACEYGFGLDFSQEIGLPLVCGPKSSLHFFFVGQGFSPDINPVKQMGL